jgi:hypothetical protein
MNRSEAITIDTSFYAELDEETGDFCVFGDNSGFAYASFASFPQAQESADEMNEEK